MYSFYSIKGWYELILLSGRVIQTHFTQCKGDTNSFYSIERWYKLILLHERVTHIHFIQWKGDTNSFYSMEGWYKCILLQWMKKQTQLTCNEKETQTEGWYKLIFLSGRVILIHLNPRKWYNLILIHGRKKQTHLTWKGDTNWRVTHSQFTPLKNDTNSCYSYSKFKMGRTSRNINETKFSVNNMHIFTVTVCPF